MTAPEIPWDERPAVQYDEDRYGKPTFSDFPDDRPTRAEAARDLYECGLLIDITERPS